MSLDVLKSLRRFLRMAVAFPGCFEAKDGRLHLAAYETTKEVNVKMRWRQRRLQEVMQLEFGCDEAYAARHTSKSTCMYILLL